MADPTQRVQLGGLARGGKCSNGPELFDLSVGRAHGSAGGSCSMHSELTRTCDWSHFCRSFVITFICLNENCSVAIDADGLGRHASRVQDIDSTLEQQRYKVTQKSSSAGFVRNMGGRRGPASQRISVPKAHEALRSLEFLMINSQTLLPAENEC